MSERDRNLLAEVGLNMEEVAAALSVSRQAVSKGIDRSSDYLGADRLRLIVEYLKIYSSAKIKDLSDFAEAHLSPTEKATVLSARVHGMPDDPGRTTDFRELLVFSFRPRELSEVEYLKMMLHKDRLLNPDKCFAYYLPPAVAEEFGDLLRDALVDSPSCAKITVYDCGQRMDIAPHCVIMDHSDPGLFRGWVSTYGPQQFARLSAEDTKRIIVEVDKMERAGKLESPFSTEARRAKTDG